MIAMGKKIGILVGGVILVFIVMASVTIANNSRNPVYNFQTVANRVMKMDFSSYDVDTIIPADTNSGNISEKIKGDPDAKVVVYEYADYACSHCAELNTVVNKIVSDYDGKVKVVFRNYLINYFKNNAIVAHAATAADLQGYWEPYKDKLFEEQATWYYKDSSEIRDYLGELFDEVTEGKGDKKRFYKDLDSEAVAKRVAFEFGLGAQIEEIEGTPYFRINGKAVAASELRSTIEELVK